MSVETLRPLRVGEILDAAIKVFRDNATTLMGLTALIVVPLQAVSAIVLLSTVTTTSQVPHGLSLFGTRSTGGDHASSLGATLVLDLTAFVLTLLTTAACVKAVSDAYLGGSPRIGSSLRFAARRLPALIGMYLLYGLGLGLAFLALIVPGVWLYGLWSVCAPALLVERRSPVSALGRSRRLVRGRWWPTAGVVLIANLMASVVSASLGAGVIFAVALTDKGSVVAYVLGVSFASAVASLFVRPFQAAVTTVLYYDLRVRHEGYDIELLAEQLGLPATTLAPAPLPLSRPLDPAGAEGGA